MYDPDLSTVPIGEPDFRAATAPVVPDLEQHVLYRHDEHGDVLDALVVGVEFDDGSTPHAGSWFSSRWPLVTLETPFGLVKTRQALIRGSAGWLPLTWIEERA